MHRLLRTQLRKFFGGEDSLPAGTASFVKAVDQAYQSAEEDRLMLERSLDLTSDELRARFDRLASEVGERIRAEAALRLSRQELEDRVIARTAELERANEALAVAKAQLSQSLQMAQAGGWSYDIQSDQFTFDESFYNIFGTSMEMVGTANLTAAEYASRFVHPDDRKIVEHEIALALESKEPNYFRQTEHRFIYADGRIGHLAVRIVGSRDAQGRLTALSGVNQDITQRKLLEQEILRARDSALTLAKTKGDFLANMSHEIRTPLNAVIGMSGLLDETALDARQRDYANTIRVAGESLLCIVNDILDFSKIEAGMLTLEEADFDPREVLDEAIQLVAGSVRQKGLELSVGAAPSVPDHVHGDAGRLRQVLLNVLSNAVKFTDKGGISVSMEHDGSKIRYEIKDSGIGISQENQANLFKPFSQGDSSMSRRFGGTGLGLTICRRLVELMGGDISFSSEVGIGTTFRITVAAPIVFVKEEKRLAGCPVRVVSGDPLSQSCWEEALTRAGARLISGEDADGRPAAIVLDLSPMDASEFLKSVPQGVFVVRISRSGEPGSLIMPVRRSAVVDSVLRGIEKKPAAPLFRAAASAGSRRVLVVEDNAVNQRVVLSMLRSLGHEGEAVSSGKEAIEACARIQYDLILMDIQMPGLDGYETTRAIRAAERKDARGRIVALTANVLEGDRDRCLDAGMDDYLSKPIRMADLIAKIGDLDDGVTGGPSSCESTVHNADRSL